MYKSISTRVYSSWFAAPNSSFVEVRALLNNASLASFVSVHLVQCLGLPPSSPNSPIQSIASFRISAAHHNGSIDLTAIILPKVIWDLPVSPVPFKLSWKHVTDLPLADPSFGEPVSN